MDKVKKPKATTYRLSLINNASHRIIKGFKFTKTDAVVAVSCTVFGAVLLIYCLIAFTPLRVTIPGYPSGPQKKLAVENSLKIDSLETVITRWNLYAENLGRVLAGEATVNFDSLVRSSSHNYLSDKSEEQLRIQDSLLRQSVRTSERFGIGSTDSRLLPVEGMHFFTPVKGVVSQGFQAASHPCTEITANPGTIVSAALDGMVIYTGWDEAASSYVIVLQHQDNVISVCKGCGQLLKRSGESVKAGTPLGTAGVAGSSGSCTITFELWHNGRSIDAARYINF